MLTAEVLFTYTPTHNTIVHSPIWMFVSNLLCYIPINGNAKHELSLVVFENIRVPALLRVFHIIFKHIIIYVIIRILTLLPELIASVVSRERFKTLSALFAPAIPASIISATNNHIQAIRHGERLQLPSNLPPRVFRTCSVARPGLLPRLYDHTEMILLNKGWVLWNVSFFFVKSSGKLLPPPSR